MFPSGTSTSKASSEDEQGESWLVNPSYSSADTFAPPKKKPKSAVKPAPPKPAAAKSTATVWSGESPKAYHVDASPNYSNLSYETVYSGSVASYKRKIAIAGLEEWQSVELNDGRGQRSSRPKRTVSKRYYDGGVSDVSEVMVLGRGSSELGEQLSLSSMASEATTAVTVSKSKLLDYNKRLSNEPHNVELWLEFAAAQDSLLLWEGLKEEALTERKAAIFERALESNPREVDLLLGYMKQASRLWESKMVLKKWKDIVFVHPNSPRLWTAYIDYCKNNFMGFTVEHICSLYCKAITTLSAVSEGLIKSHKPLPQASLWTLSIFSELCCFLRDAGFTERAVSCYQALIWLNISDTTVEELAQAWDSGLPRPGEKGWSGAPHLPADSSEESEPELEHSLSEREAWCVLEDHRCSHHTLPCRASEDPLDQERIVSFSDIKQSLFHLRDEELTLQLILRCLNFLGALTPALTTPPGRPLSTFVSPVQLKSGLVKVFGCLLGDDLSIGAPLYTPKASANSLEELLTLLDDYPSPPACELIPLICSQSCDRLADPSAQTTLAMVWITHSLRYLPSPTDSRHAHKLVKTLLKKEQHRNNLELWRACALVEHLTGNDCCGMFNSLLSHHLSPALVVTLVEIMLGLLPTLTAANTPTHPHGSILNPLLCLSEGRYDSQAKVTPLRIQRATFDTSSLHGALCKVYYDLLTENIAHANRTFDYLCSQHSSYELELRMKQVRLLMWSPQAQPKDLRAALDSNLAIAPGNVWLLANRSSFTDLQTLSTGQFYTAIDYLCKAVKYGTGVGLYRKAIACLMADSSPLSLWLALLVQELCEPQNTENLFYRAASSSPGSKVLYDLACSLLPTGKLSRTFELIEEKGIRLHTPLEEVQLLLAT